MTAKSKVVLITGASSGIGKVTAEYLAEQGHIVYGTSRYPGSYEKPNNHKLLQLNVTNESSIEAAIEQILLENKRINVLINNAGYGIAGAIEDISIDKAKEQFETNFFGPLRIIRRILPIMREQEFGTIINISSIGGLIGLPYQSLYSATKFAVEGYTEALYKELHSSNIKVVIVEPGDFKTDFTSNRMIINKSVKSKQFNQTLKEIENDEMNGENPIKIAKLIYKIIRMKNPRLRYVTGSFDQKLAVFLKRILPNRLFDWIIMKHYKI